MIDEWYDTFPDPVCPACGDSPEDTLFIQNGMVIGCDCCIDFYWFDRDGSVPDECPCCGSRSFEKIYFRRSDESTIYGCDGCITEMDPGDYEYEFDTWDSKIDYDRERAAGIL